MKDKGISPLIAAVILIAFVIAIAGVASGFFTSFMQSKTSQVSEAGTETINCGVATIKIESDTVDYNESNSLSFAVEAGQTKLPNITATTYGDSVDTHNTSVTLEKGETKNVVLEENIGSNIDRIKVGTPVCPNQESVVTKEGNDWVLQG